MENLHKLKYPIGEYLPNISPSIKETQENICTIERFPTEIENLISEVSEEALNWRYRPKGWTVRQVIHHCTDSHMNSLIRFKWALTENTPTIKGYLEDKWAELADDQEEDVSNAIALLKALHHKWVILLKSLTEELLKMGFIHPEHGRELSVAETIGLYAWHCQHHLAHIKNGIESEGIYNG